MTSGRRSGDLLAVATVFSGASLLFVIEPLIAKKILPWFGGSASVWTTCLLFFQVALLTGYLYAHVLARYVPARLQPFVHLALLVASLAALPIVPSETWKPLGNENPLLQILGLLASTIGLPFVLLSATNPLVQAWITAEPKGAPPYWLFGVSNFGSLLALLSYPLLIEPQLSLRFQSVVWSVLYAAFVVVAAATGWRYRPLALTGVDPPTLDPIRLQVRAVLLWLALAAAPSALLLALTNYMLQNIAAVPLFWVVPLALYLLSFIFAFGALGWFVLPHWYTLFGVAIVALVIPMIIYRGPVEPMLLPLFAAALFVCCTVCHCELALSRPAVQHLTSYYLLIAAGGAAGGLFVAVVAPLLFDTSYELRVLIPFTAALVFVAASGHYEQWAEGMRGRFLLVSAAAFTLTVAIVLAWIGFRDNSGNLFLARNFYGPLRVFETVTARERIRLRVLVSGEIIHGYEAVLPARRREARSYYSRESGIGLALTQLSREGSIRVGVLGLGVGTIAAYGRRGDVFRFYEINPLVAKIAKDDFWYLGLSPARCDIVLGDGRLSLEREPPQKFDLLAIDAFISDAIPLHLLTREAFALYWRHLKPNGVLAVHVSNRFVDLAPMVAEAARADGKPAWLIAHEGQAGHSGGTRWVLVSSRHGFFDGPALRDKHTIRPSARMWTDDYSSIWSVLRL